MVKEAAIQLYLLAYKLLFTLFNFQPLKDKVTFVVSFGDNSKYVYEEILRQNKSVDVVVLYKGSSNRHFTEFNELTLLPMDSFNLIAFIKTNYHLATSRTIFVDNYFAFLAVTDFKEDVECIQLWHASGALKKFGLEDQSITKRNRRAHERFLKVYEKFHKVVVGSDNMANIFMKSFNLSKENILRTGIPRTDFFYDEKTQNQIVDKLIKENQDLKRKKKVLYAPTYRDKQLDHFEMKLELDQMFKELGTEYVVLLRLHPAIKKSVDYEKLYPGFVYDYSSSSYDINDLLIIANYLITDYSSIPYEFSLLNKPMIFFAYDLESYKMERGLLEGYEETVPGPVVKTTSEIIELIKKDQFNLEQLKDYAGKWNKYSTGKSSQNLVRYVFNKEVEETKVKRRAL